MTKQELIITRTFKAPLLFVWEAFSTAEHLAQWWGPKGFDTVVKQFQFEINGVFHYGLKGPDGSIMWGKFNYKEIDKPTKLAFTNAFSNEEGELVPAPEIPFGKDWPLEILNTITFKEQDDTTLMKMISYPMHPTEESLQTFGNNIQNMEIGFNGTFNNLESFLKIIK